jgi:hypothetical protein
MAELVANAQMGAVPHHENRTLSKEGRMARSRFSTINFFDYSRR